MNLTDINEKIDKQQQSSQAWKNLLSKKTKTNTEIPLCQGHKEPCVSRTVKKAGKNQGKSFYACARGKGRTNDPMAQCDFFAWQ